MQSLTYTIPINISEYTDGGIDDKGHWQATVDYINNEDYDYYEVELDNTYDYLNIEEEEMMSMSKSYKIYPEYLDVGIILENNATGDKTFSDISETEKPEGNIFVADKTVTNSFGEKIGLEVLNSDLLDNGSAINNTIQSEDDGSQNIYATESYADGTVVEEDGNLNIMIQ